MTQLYLVRHGAYTFLPHKWPSDQGLSQLGREQSERLRDRLATGEIKADVLISSPAPRAQQTAEIFAPTLNLPVELDAEVEEWRNMSQGTPNLDLVAELRATPYDQRAFYSPGTGCESGAEFAFRACTALNRITTQHAGKNIVVVCHGGIIEASFMLFYGFSPLQPSPVTMLLDPAYTSITHWRKIRGLSFEQWRLCEYNDAAHLR